MTRPPLQAGSAFLASPRGTLQGILSIVCFEGLFISVAIAGLLSAGQASAAPLASPALVAAYSSVDVIGLVVSWGSAVLYMTSRLPQIVVSLAN